MTRTVTAETRWQLSAVVTHGWRRAGAGQRRPGGFEVHLDVFEGPFDLLLGLISKHKLDITEVALSQVTDEFIAHIRALADGWDLDQASYFLVVAATLLDLKAARLLPAGEVDDEEDLALLEARDLLFARLLQYRAYKEVAAVLAGRMAVQGRRFPRRVPMEPRFAELLPEVLLGLGPAEFAAIAAPAAGPAPAARGVHRAPAHRRGPACASRPTILADRLRRLRPGHVPPADRGLRGHLRGRGPVPGRARAVPGRPGHARPGHPARRAVRDLVGRAGPDGRRPRMPMTADEEERVTPWRTGSARPATR